MADFYAARRGIIPPLPWPTFSPPFSSYIFGDELQVFLINFGFPF